MNTKLKILIVDDEVLIAEHLKDLLVSLSFANIHLAHNKKSALSALTSFSPDLALLDIRMEGEKDGIEIGNVIYRSYKIPFIYITAHSDVEMLRSAMEVKPSGYITKPFKKMDIYAAINIAMQFIDKDERIYFTFRDGFKDARVDVNEIIYAESDGNYINLFTSKNRYLIRNSLDWFLQSVPPEQFMRVHRSFVINNRKIEKASSSHVVVSGKEIPVSRKSIKQLRRVFLSP